MKYILPMVKVHYLYHLKRKYEKVLSFFESKVCKGVFINRIMVVAILLVPFILTNILYLLLASSISRFYPEHTSLVVSIYFIVFIISFVAESFAASQRILLPVNRDVFSLAPISNRKIVLLNWFLQFMTHSFGMLIQFISVGIVLLLTTSYFNKVEYWVFFLFFIGTVVLMHCSLTIYLCFVSYKNIVKGYYLNSLFMSLIKSVIVFIVSLSIFNFIFTLIQSIRLTLDKRSFWQTTGYFIRSILEKFTSVSQAFSGINHISAGLKILIASLIFFIVTYILLAGKWVRTEWQYSKNGRKDWLELVKCFYQQRTKNEILKTQIIKLFESREQLRNNYSYFYLHHFNFIFVALAVSIRSVGIDNGFAYVLLIYIIYNTCSKDAFSQVELFPGLLRFDSERNAMTIYKLTGVPFSAVYKSKINLQRMLGLPEFCIMFTIYWFVLQPSLTVLLFGISLALFNFVVNPHLDTITSFVFPHFKYQHFTEVEEFVEDSFIVDKIGYQFKRAIVLLFIFLVLFLLFLEVSLDIIFIWSAILYLPVTLLSYIMIKRIITKKEEYYDKSDFT
jgi:hypothetical protein